MSRATQVPPCLWTGFRVRGCHPLWRAFPRASAILSIWRHWRSYYPGRCLDTPGLGWGAFARHYSRHHFCFLFLRVLRCFSSPGSPRALRGAGIASGGLPHSDIRGSRDMCSSPRLFAACRVLHRPSAPGHPPWTYVRLAIRPLHLTIMFTCIPSLYISNIMGFRPTASSLPGTD